MSHDLHDKSILFIGAGSMAEAILRGLTHRQVADPDKITVVNRSNQAKLHQLESDYGVHTLQDPQLVAGKARQSDIVILAMKPIDAPKAIAAYRTIFHADQLLISVIAGLSIDIVHGLLNDTRIPVARTMPNTSSSIGLGMTGISFSAQTGDIHRKLTLAIFESVGEVLLLEEERMHILTGISGSGPAYIYAMMEALVSGGVRGGLSREEALQLAVSTVRGAAAMVQQTGEDPADLRRKVTSPNGTTQAALTKLADYQFNEAVEQAVLRCAERSREIAGIIETAAGEHLD